MLTKTHLRLPITWPQQTSLLLSLLSVGAIILLPISPLRLGFTFLLVCFWPGLALVEGLFAGRKQSPSLVERLLLGLGASYVVTIVGGLWLYYLLGRLTLNAMLGLYVFVCLTGFGLAIIRSRPTPFATLRGHSPFTIRHSPFTIHHSPLLLFGLLAFAAYYRFYFLSYSDFRGDEAEVVLRAVAALRGQGQPILSHTKGPAETLLVTAMGLLYGAYSELAARLPFALGNLLAVAAIHLLGQRLFGRRTALIGCALVAINGWYITYGRTAQYQNIVLPMLTLGLWGYVRFYQYAIRHSPFAIRHSPFASSHYLLLGTLFLAVATFGHYEGASAAPAALYLLTLALKGGRGAGEHSPTESTTQRSRGEGFPVDQFSVLSLTDKLKTDELKTESPPLPRSPAPLPLRSLWPVGLSLLIGAVIVLSFYLPFLLSPTVAGAQSHVAKRFGGAPPYNNWGEFYVNGLFYNSGYYVWGVGFILLLGALRGVKQALGDGRAGFISALIVLPLLLLSWPGLLPPWYALLVYLGLMSLFLLSKRVSMPVKTMLLWILLPAGLYLFAVVRPGNHYYVFMPPLMLLAALTIDWGLRSTPRRGVRRLERPRRAKITRRWALPVAVGLALILYGLSAWYAQLVFMRTGREYLLTYPAHQNPLFWSDPRFPFDIRIGWGFPYRLGWQTMAELYRSGQLAGDWYSNDEGNSLTWYTLGWPDNPCYPRYYMLSEITYREPPLDVPLEQIEAYYTLRATVQVNGQPRLRLYEFTPKIPPSAGLGGETLQPPVAYQEPNHYPTPYRPHLFRGGENMKPDRRPTIPLNPPRRFKPHPDMLAQVAEVYQDANAVLFQEEVSLLGYDLDLTWAEPGGLALLTLYWRADSPVFLPYKVFTHLGQAGTPLAGERIWAQADSEPGCGRFPTYTWRTGDSFVDRHLIPLPADIPPGEYPLQVGLYEIRTNLRLDLLDELGHPAGNSLTLPAIPIRPPSPDPESNAQPSPHWNVPEGGSPFAIRHSPFATRHSPFATRHSPLAIRATE